MAALRFGGRADPYLEWAVYTGFADYHAMRTGGHGNYVGLLVQWRPGVHPLTRAQRFINVASVYQTSRCAAITVDATWLASSAAAKFFQQAARIELAAPVAPISANPVVHSLNYVSVTAPDSVVLGCIDDGFALANMALFDVNGSNRVVRFWNQNNEASVVGKPLGVQPDDPPEADFSYGKELKAPVANQPGLPISADRADESAYYERVRMNQMRRRITHGAHVLDLFAGPRTARTRFATSRDVHGNGDGSSTSPAAPVPAASNATGAPIVLVQLPKYAVDDPSGNWLSKNVMDGLHYILRTAGSPLPPNPPIRKIVVNVSWGPQTGPRDGSSVLETAMADLVAQQAQPPLSRELVIVLAAGNSRNLRAHAEFDATAGCNPLVWCVPPALESPSQLEVWWPDGIAAAQARITVTAPNGVVVTSVGTGNWPPPAAVAASGWGISQVLWGNRVRAVVNLAPTFFRDVPGVAAPHGRWRIQVAPVAAAVGRVHVNVARTAHNMGGRRSRSSYLLDQAYEDFRRSRLGSNGTPPPASLVQPGSTLSGIATGTRTTVAAGYRLADAAASTYSSQGPCVSRKGPDLAYPTDESGLMVGIKGGAVRSGSVFRLVGTSVAAPQLARDLADGQTVPVGPPDPRLGLGRR